MSVIDARGRDVIDFDRIRERLAGLTHAAQAISLRSGGW
jgi:hypothetical protein